MDDSKWLSLDQIRAFLAGAEPVEFAAQGRTGVYGWLEGTLARYEYARQGKADKGLLRRYVEKMTGLSRAQVTRLITAYTATGRVKATEYERRRFAARYTKADVELLAYVDKAHGNLSGPATTPTVIAIGERRRPEPNGRPGFLRIDTVHRGDFDGLKGVYHINAVDEATQWEVMAATPKISEL